MMFGYAGAVFLGPQAQQGHPTKHPPQTPNVLQPYRVSLQRPFFAMPKRKGAKKLGWLFWSEAPAVVLGPLLHLQINMINTVRGEVCQVGHEQELYLTFADWFILSALGYTQVDPGWTKEWHKLLVWWSLMAWHVIHHMAVCQNLVPLVNIKIAGKWMFIPLKMVLIGIDPYPHSLYSFYFPKQCGHTEGVYHS